MNEVKNTIYANKIHNSRVTYNNLNISLGSVLNYNSTLYILAGGGFEVKNYNNSRVITETENVNITNIGNNAFSIINYDSVPATTHSANIRSYIPYLGGNNIISWNKNEAFFIGKSSIDDGINLQDLWNIKTPNLNFNTLSKIYYDTNINSAESAILTSLYNRQYSFIVRTKSIKECELYYFYVYIFKFYTFIRKR